MLDLFSHSLWLIPTSVFVAGLIGSPHCLSMCGPLVINFAQNKKQMLSYQLGRMLVYTGAGAMFGEFGERALGSARPLWLSSLSLALIAALLLINGFRAWTGRAIHFPIPNFAQNFSKQIWRSMHRSKLSKNSMAGAAGVLTIFLPCGHLYSFLVGAIATGSAARGAAYMFAFWLGSAPLLSVGAVWLQTWLRSHLPSRNRWAGAFLVLAGLFGLMSFGARLEMNPPVSSHESPGSELRCHR